MTSFLPIKPWLLCYVLVMQHGLIGLASDQVRYRDLNIATYYDHLNLALEQLAARFPEFASSRDDDDPLLQRSRRNSLIIYGKLCERVRNGFYRFGQEHPDMLQADDLAVWRFLDQEFKSPANRFAMDWNTVDPAHIRQVLQDEWDFHLRSSQGVHGSEQTGMSAPSKHDEVLPTERPPPALRVVTKVPSMSPASAKEAARKTRCAEKTETVPGQDQLEATPSEDSSIREVAKLGPKCVFLFISP